MQRCRRLFFLRLKGQGVGGRVISNGRTRDLGVCLCADAKGKAQRPGGEVLGFFRTTKSVCMFILQ